MDLLERLRGVRVIRADDYEALKELIAAVERTLDNADHPSSEWPETVKNLRAALARVKENKA